MLGCVLIVACWRGGAAPTTGTVGNHEAVAQRDTLSGGYWCTIDDYGRFPCAIRKLGGRFVLAKLGGSQRFEGVIVPTGDGFTFDGRFYCPYGDCTQALHGAFARKPGGGYQGTFDDAAIVVQLERAPDSAFGGTSYGGDEYGGFSYGGAMGGQTYGQDVFSRPRPRNPRR